MMRPLRSVLTAVALSLVLVALPSIQAGADPAFTNPSDSMARLGELSRQSEQTTEALHNAQIDLEAKQSAQREAEAAAANDQGALDAARERIEVFRPAVNQLATSTYQGARTNRLFAVMTSDSPQQLLDQMSLLDIIAKDTSNQVDQFWSATSDATRAAEASKSSADAAREAAEQAKAVSDDLQRKQSDLQAQIDQVLEAFGNLSASEREELAGTPFPPGIDPATILAHLTPGAGTNALRAALTRVGSPYSWGATGPNEFDCSGLVVWAYQQIGKTLPRSSQAQASGGMPVSREDLQPGDLVLFYDDASHVGLYAGNGNIVHASTFGVPVKVESMARFPYYGARRY
ncbi:protein p60 precursor [Rhodococcus sp. WMMA185]|uniref:NlpC/P60 family protein n=1 Tax=Rhodococcus sp. WMMA185 TaxID=679318 RepID=UPI00087825E5|nr:NlpC/P60 family protein [Rhodococcus sp. WMMA185]AOW92880.1 protein p60 precursor [Rhodococcus sp. WMMA185]